MAQPTVKPKRVPGPTHPKHWVEWVLEMLIVLGALIPLGIKFTEELSEDGSAEWWYLLAVGVVLIVGIIKVFVALRNARAKERLESPVDLSACVHVLHQLLTNAAKAPTDSDTVRITIHRVLGDECQQCIPYVGCTDGGAGRKFSSRSGIIGRAVLLRKPLVGTRVNDNHEEFIKELVDKWHIPEKDARMLRQDRRAWMAVPIIGSNNEPIGVVYLDSSRRDFFDDGIQNIVLWGSEGIVSFLSERYA